MLSALLSVSETYFFALFVIISRDEVYSHHGTKLPHRDLRPRLCRGWSRACLRRPPGCRLAGCEYVSCELDQLSGRYLIYNSLVAEGFG